MNKSASEIAGEVMEARLSDGHFRALAEAQYELISIAQTDGTLLYVNPSYAQHVAMQPAQLIGRSLYDYVEADDAESVRELLDTVARTGKTSCSLSRTKTQDSSE